jgi:hypothetical protein
MTIPVERLNATQRAEEKERAFLEECRGGPPRLRMVALALSSGENKGAYRRTICADWRAILGTKAVLGGGRFGSCSFVGRSSSSSSVTAFSGRSERGR